MKTSATGLALDLARTGISVLHRNARGLWQPIGTVALNAPDFELSLARLRKTVADSFGANFQTEIWLPADQVMFRAVRLSETRPELRSIELRNAVAAMSRMQDHEMCISEGITDEKSYTHVAAITRETRAEAVAFAEKWGFNACRVTTRLPAEGFQMAPVFSQEAVKTAPRKLGKLPSLVAGALAMALMLPVAMQLSPDQEMPREILALPAQVVLEPEVVAEEVSQAVVETVVLEKGPEVSLGPELGAAPRFEESMSIELPRKAELFDRDVTKNSAAQPEPVKQSQDKALDVLVPGPNVMSESGALPLEFSGDVLNVALPKNGSAIRMPLEIAGLVDTNPAPEVVDAHAQLWISSLRGQPTFRRGGPEFKRPSLNGLRRSPGVLRLSFKLNFAPDAVPGITAVTSSEASGGFLQRTLNNINFDPEQDQAVLDLNPRSVFIAGAEREVADFRDGILLVRPGRRIVSDAGPPDGSLRPPRRNEGADVLRSDPQPAPPLEDIVVEPLRPSATAQTAALPIEAGPEIWVERPKRRKLELQASVESNRPPEAVLSSEDDVFLARPKPRKSVQAVEAAVEAADVPPELVEEPLESVPEVEPAAQVGFEIARPARRAKEAASPDLPSSDVPFDNRAKQEFADGPDVARPARRPLADATVLETPIEESERVALARPARRPVVEVAPNAQTEIATSNEAPGETAEIRAPGANETVEPAADTPEVAAADAQAPKPAKRPAQVSGPVVQTALAAPNALREDAAAKKPGEELGRVARLPDAEVEIVAVPQDAEDPVQLEGIERPRPKPRLRKVSVAVEESDQPTAVDEPKGPISKFAVASALSPKARPKGLKAAADRLRKERKSVEKIVAKTQAPRKSVPAANLRLPSNASVKRAATIVNGINLSKISLLGVSGTSAKRKAMIRLPRGRVVSVARGGRVNGWRVSAIGEQSVRLQKGSRSQVLRMPN